MEAATIAGPIKRNRKKPIFWNWKYSEDNFPNETKLHTHFKNFKKEIIYRWCANTVFKYGPSLVVFVFIFDDLKNWSLFNNHSWIIVLLYLLNHIVNKGTLMQY